MWARPGRGARARSPGGGGTAGIAPDPRRNLSPSGRQHGFPRVAAPGPSLCFQAKASAAPASKGPFLNPGAESATRKGRGLGET